PYTLSDLQRYVASGNILPADMARSEGMQDWAPVSQIIGNIGPMATAAPPVPPPFPGYGQTPGYGQAAVYGQAPAYSAYDVAQTQTAEGPLPPNLHWGLLTLLQTFVFSIYMYAILHPQLPRGSRLLFITLYWSWMFVQAAYVRKVDPSS